ncbi:hypothetical protein BLNAU_8503 [Blattamonas nauphoetae]|uniref:Uncharacterized protein n=1 Tax=Blattamonas nauphoetae TaxID=2049346 RepID=A0ABQ9XYB8_9EUKA|nr:hypothetical protein BLNAU_8503 [Blattamonas nauphoetae]
MSWCSLLHKQCGTTLYVPVRDKHSVRWNGRAVEISGTSCVAFVCTSALSARRRVRKEGGAGWADVINDNHSFDETAEPHAEVREAELNDLLWTLEIANEWDFEDEATFADCWCGEGKHGRWIDITNLLFAHPRHAQMASSSNELTLANSTLSTAEVEKQGVACPQAPLWDCSDRTRRPAAHSLSCARLAADLSGTILVVDHSAFTFTSQLELDLLISSSSAGKDVISLTQPPEVVSDMKLGSSSSLTLVSLVFCARLSSAHRLPDQQRWSHSDCVDCLRSDEGQCELRSSLETDDSQTRLNLWRRTRGCGDEDGRSNTRGESLLACLVGKGGMGEWSNGEDSEGVHPLATRAQHWLAQLDLPKAGQIP